MGWVGSWYGLVWFGQNSEAEFKTMNQLITRVGIELLGQLKRCRGWLPTQIYPKLWHCQTKDGDLVLGPKPKLLKVSMNKMLGFFMEEN